MSTFTVNLNQARNLVEQAIRAKLVPMIHGSPAIGKSAIVHQIAADYGLKVIDLRLSQCDPVDLLGFPQVDAETGKGRYAPMETFPTEHDEVPDGYTGWLIFLDELSSAKEAVQAAAYKLVYDRMVGNMKLHKNVAMVAAGNLESDNAIVEPMSTALQSRLIHMEVHLDHNLWLDWAVQNHIDHRVTSFIKFKPGILYNFDPDHDDKTYPAPRTWNFTSLLIQGKAQVDKDDAALLSGTIGEGAAREFIQFCKVYTQLPTIDQIIANPTTTPVSDEPSIKFAITGSIASHANASNIGQLMKYVERIDKEFQVICLREVVRRDGKLLDHSAVINWCSVNAAALF